MSTLYRSSLVGYYQIVQRPVSNFSECFLTYIQRSSVTVAHDELVTPDLVVNSEDELPRLHLWTHYEKSLRIDNMSFPGPHMGDWSPMLDTARRLNMTSTKIYQMLVTYRELTHSQALLAKVTLQSVKDAIDLKRSTPQSEPMRTFTAFVDDNLSSIETLNDVQAIVLAIETLSALSNNILQ